MVFTFYNLSDMQDAAHIMMTFDIVMQGCKVNQLRNPFQNFYGSYLDLVAKYQKSVTDMLNDSFPF